MTPFNPEGERRFRLSPEEQKRHEEVLKRKSVFQEKEARAAGRSLERTVENNLSPEEQEAAYKKSVEHRDSPRL